LDTLRKSDILVVPELSRLAKSMKDAFIITDALFKKKVRKIIEPMVEAGKTRQEMVDARNESGIKGRGGGQWHLTTLVSVLKLLDL
jgi:DNA invertase Pin-like site-specific DNA recombinase